ncbi:MAG: hypothetical protein AAB515_00160 [Patescibacteria group bacterium]
MSEQNRGPRRGPQNHDDRPKGGNRTQDDRTAIHALQITKCVYDPYISALVVEVQAVRGKKPWRTTMLELLVNGSPVFTDTTNWSGILKFLIKDFKLPINKHRVTVRAVGMLDGDENELTIQASELFDVLPTSAVPSNAVRASVQHVVETQENAFAVTCVVSTTRNDIVVPDVKVDLVGYSETVQTVQTGPHGEAKAVLILPFLEDGSKRLVPIRAIVQGVGTVFSDILELIPPPEPIPYHVDFSDPEQMETKGTYTVRAKAEYKDGQPVKGARLTVTGFGNEKPFVTNLHGVAILELACDPNTDWTKFRVDVSGNKQSQIYDLPSALGQESRAVKSEEKLLLPVPVPQHFMQAFRRGARIIQYTPNTQPPPSPGLLVSNLAVPTVKASRLQRKTKAFTRFVRRNGRPTIVYGVVRPIAGLLGFCWGTNNRRSNILLFLGVPVMFAWVAWTLMLAVQAYLQHPVSEQLPNVVAGVETTLTAYRSVPMSIGNFFLLVGGTLLLSLFAMPYWVIARREEIERGFKTIKHRLQPHSGGVIELEEPGLAKQWVQTLLANQKRLSQQPTTNTANATPVTVATAPAASGHGTLLMLLTIAEVVDWVYTIYKKLVRR